jgi:hypothetical protein
LTAIPYGNGPDGTVAGVIGLSAAKSLAGALYWESLSLLVFAT